MIDNTKIPNMKYIILFSTLFLMRLSMYSQINPYWGIYDVDSCHFETQCPILKQDTSYHNIWQLGKPDKPFFDSAYSIPNALVTDTIEPYDTLIDSYFDLILPSEQYYGYGIIIGFKHKYQTDTLVDGGYIEVSYDKGISWVNVIHDTLYPSKEFNSENLYTEQDTLRGGINGFSGASDGWIYTRIQWVWAWPVDNYPPDTLMLRFHFISDSIQTNKDGWMIDNILISYADEGNAIQEVDKMNIKIEISPNPFDNSTTIKFKTVSKETLTLIVKNSLGQIVKKVNRVIENPIQINRGELQSGLYIIQLMDNNTILGTDKLIIK